MPTENGTLSGMYSAFWPLKMDSCQWYAETVQGTSCPLRERPSARRQSCCNSKTRPPPLQKEPSAQGDGLDLCRQPLKKQEKGNGNLENENRLTKDNCSVIDGKLNEPQPLERPDNGPPHTDSVSGNLQLYLPNPLSEEDENVAKSRCSRDVQEANDVVRDLRVKGICVQEHRRVCLVTYTCGNLEGPPANGDLTSKPEPGPMTTSHPSGKAKQVGSKPALPMALVTVHFGSCYEGLCAPKPLQMRSRKSVSQNAIQYKGALDAVFETVAEGRSDAGRPGQKENGKYVTSEPRLCPANYGEKTPLCVTGREKGPLQAKTLECPLGINTETKMISAVQGRPLDRRYPKYR